MLRYVRENLKDQYGILDLQEKILEVMVYLNSFCEKYSIDYCLMAGSALGARRHQGFIPWDDDMDIYMSENDYEKFRRLFRQYGDNEQFYLQEWGKVEHGDNCMVTLAKLKLNGTRINEKAFAGWNIHQGIFVDIFIVHKCANAFFKQKIQYIWSEALVLKGLQIRGYKPKNLKDKFLLNFIKIFPIILIKKIGLHFIYKYQYCDSDYLHGFIDTRDFSRAVFRRDVIFPTKYAKFENVMLKIPNKIDEYLKIQFGDGFMQPPPENLRPINKHTQGWKYCEIEKNKFYTDEYKLL